MGNERGKTEMQRINPKIKKKQRQDEKRFRYEAIGDELQIHR
jgi:hypothetical protein